MKITLSILLSMLSASVALAANAPQTAINNGLTTLVDLVVLAGLAGALTDGSTDLTILAPTNAAFAALPAVVTESLTKPWNKDILSMVLLYHVFGAKIESPAVAALASANAKTPPTLHGGRIDVSNCQGGVGICLNGDANIVAVDVAFENTPKSGVVHVINKVLVPRALSLPVNTIVGIVTNMNNNGNLKFLFRALSLFPDYVNALNTFSANGYTVFAPTDAAFCKVLPKRCRRNLGACRALLANVLPYHVVPAAAKSSDLTDGQNLPTLKDGSSLEVDLIRNRIKIDGAFVRTANIRASNGIIHVIDAVLIP